MASATEKSVKGIKTGVVESDSRDKTRTVALRSAYKHPKYGKYVNTRTRLSVHDEKNESRRGDVVEIVQCKPVSKTKRWALSRIVERRTGIDDLAGVGGVEV